MADLHRERPDLLAPRGTERADRHPDLAVLGRRQSWMFSRAQLRELGWSARRVEHELDLGRWRAWSGTVVAAHNGPLDHEQRLWLGVLHAGSSAVLSHLSACLVAGLRWTASPTIHVLTQKGDLVSALPGYWFHQTRRRFWDWATRPEHEPPRLALPYAALLTAERDRRIRRAIGLLAATVQQGLVTPEDLLLASRHIPKLRHGKQFRLALGDIAGGAQSFAEIDVGRLCADAGLAQPRRQVRRRDATGRVRYLDHEWTLPDGRRLVLEVDGSFHMRSEQWWADKSRERAEVVSGSVVLRCASVELRLQPGAVVADLVAAGVPAVPEGFVCGPPAAGM